MTTLQMFQTLCTGFSDRVVELIPDLEGDPNPTIRIHGDHGYFMDLYRCQQIHDGNGPVEVVIGDCWMVTCRHFYVTHQVLTTGPDVPNVVRRMMAIRI